MIAAKGAAMGAADVVPGVSGGTIALLTGIYPRLINAITSLNINTLKQLFEGDIKGFWQALDGHFILPLLIGIGLSFAILAHPIKHAIEFYPIPTWSFFFGLIIASAILIIKQIPDKIALNYLWLIPGIIFGFWVGSMTHIPFPSNQFAIFIAGMLAICAMILPGISGSFILVLLGMYQMLITAVADRQIITLLIFMVGAVIGLLFFSRVIKWVLNKYYQQSLFFLSGLMLGSLIKVWPWKQVSYDSNNVKTVINTVPSGFGDSNNLIAIGIIFFAIFVVFVVDYLGRKLSQSSTN